MPDNHKKALAVIIVDVERNGGVEVVVEGPVSSKLFMLNADGTILSRDDDDAVRALQDQPLKSGIYGILGFPRAKVTATINDGSVAIWKSDGLDVEGRGDKWPEPPPISPRLKGHFMPKNGVTMETLLEEFKKLDEHVNPPK